MAKKLRWTAATSIERNRAIELIKDCISTHDGYIMNFNIFSDLAINLCIEIQEHQILNLYEGLKKIVTISDVDDTVNPQSKKDWLIFMNISFGKGTGSLKSDIPEVP